MHHFHIQVCKPSHLSTFTFLFLSLLTYGTEAPRWPNGKRTALEAPNPAEEALKAIWGIEGSVSYVCVRKALSSVSGGSGLSKPRSAQTGSGPSGFRSPPARSEPQEFRTVLEFANMDVKIYDVLPLLRQDQGFAKRFMDPTTDAAAYTSDLRLPALSFGGSRELEPQLVYNNKPIFIAKTVESVYPPSRVQGGHRMREGTPPNVADRFWHRWGADPSLGNPAVSSVYEVKTEGGEIQNDKCDERTVNGPPVKIPYRAQLWVYGNPKVRGLGGYSRAPPVCPNDRVAGRSSDG